jgi:hypothetical protein
VPRTRPRGWQMAESARDFFLRYVQAISNLDFDALETMIHPDYVGFYPQSGERIRGFAMLRKQLESYPGGLRGGDVSPNQSRVIGLEERWAISPGYTVLPLAGPERFTTVARVRYPDESLWWVVTVVELKDDKVFRSEAYFAPDFEPPEWRRDFVEIVPREAI